MPSTVVIGSSSVEPGAPLALELTQRIRGATALGVRGSSVSSWIDAPVPTEVRGSVVVVYLPGQQRGATEREVRRLDEKLRAAGATDVLWCLPPVFRAGRERDVTGPTAAAIAAARVSLAREGRMHLEPSHLQPDGVHLTREGARAYAAHLFDRSSGWLPAGILTLAVVAGLAAWQIAR